MTNPKTTRRTYQEEEDLELQSCAPLPHKETVAM
jgi:hypothetical protein